MSLVRLSRNALAAAAQVAAVTVSLAFLYWLMITELGVERVGIWSLVMSVASVGRLGEAGLGTATMRFVSRDLGREEGGRPGETVATAVLLVAAGTTALALLVWPALGWLLGRLIDDAASLALARRILPHALFVMVAMAVASVLLGVVDAFQRTPRRAAVMVAAAVLQVVLAWAWLPRHGLVGLAWVQVVQAAFVLVGGAVVAGVLLRARGVRFGMLPRAAFVELLRFGSGLQLSTLAQLFFEPIAKALITHFGGLAATGLFEVVNRAIVQTRALIVAAFQMLVPFVAGRFAGAAKPADAAVPLRRATVFVQCLVVLFLPIMAGALPPVLALLLPETPPETTVIVWLCALGWSVNLLTLPAYMFALAFGRVAWTVESHLIIGVGCATLGTLGGWLGGGAGVVLGTMLALALGSASVVVRWARALGDARGRWVSRELAVVLAANLAIIALWSRHAADADVWEAMLAPAVAAVLTLAALGGAWRFGALRRQLAR